MPLLSAKQLASELGFQVDQIRKLAKMGKIPAEKYASEWRFDLAAVRRSATYVDPISADAHRTAQKMWMRPRRRVGGRR